MPSPTGLAARLLDRADGGVSTLRPRIPQIFAAEQARAAPMLERTEEVAAAPPASSPRRDAPVAAPPPAVATAAATVAQRLMPSLAAPAPQVAAGADDPAIDPHPATPAPTPTPDAPATPITWPAPGPMSDPGSPPAARAQPRPRQTDSLSAAVMQLLAPDTMAPAAAREAEPDRSRDRAQVQSNRPAVLAVSAQAPASERAPTEPGLTIHIGEIVVAPEPRPAAREAAPRPAWQPPLSLAEYRATRTRERR